MTALRMQYDSDFEYARQVGEALGVEINPYNNSLLVSCLVREVSSWFDNQEEVIEEITGFMYDRYFGRYLGKQVISFEELWYSIEKPSTNTTEDEEYCLYPPLTPFPILDEGDSTGERCRYMCVKHKSLVKCNECLKKIHE